MLKLLISIAVLLSARPGHGLKCHTYQCGTFAATTVAPAASTAAPTAAPAPKASVGDTTTCPAPGDITPDKLGIDECKAPYDACTIRTTKALPANVILNIQYGCVESNSTVCLTEKNAEAECPRCNSDLCNAKLPLVNLITSNSNTGTTIGGGAGGAGSTPAPGAKTAGSTGQHRVVGETAVFLAGLLAFCF